MRAKYALTSARQPSLLLPLPPPAASALQPSCARCRRLGVLTAMLAGDYHAETRKLLYALFGQFGKILDVVVMKTERLRGQAWIVFADITAATNSLRAMQGFPFYDKPLVSILHWLHSR